MEASGRNMNRQGRRQFERDFIEKELQKHESYFRKCYQKFFLLDQYPELASTIELGNSIQEMEERFKSIWLLK